MVTNELTTSRATPLQVARARGRVRGRLVLLGPAFVAAVAYVDPGIIIGTATFAVLGAGRDAPPAEPTRGVAG
ncbi:hypothetical protein [Micromonospora arborensis]|uniref:hypothetical protein n=1 Tax=Micromonospora arborensis TaxID=2116518 RepID=UPI001FC9AF58|nr:hypothetical protein [Micromonospora arborensis]